VHGPRALDQDGDLCVQVSTQTVIQRRQIRKDTGTFAERLRRQSGQPPQREQAADTGTARRRAHVAVQLSAGFTEFTHITQHQPGFAGNVRQ
jgi:hypothetical protein